MKSGVRKSEDYNVDVPLHRGRLRNHLIYFMFLALKILFDIFFIFFYLWYVNISLPPPVKSQSVYYEFPKWNSCFIDQGEKFFEKMYSSGGQETI